MAMEWPRRQVQTKAVMKKEKPLGDKVLADVRKKVSQIEKTLKPALENSSLSNNITKEAEQTAHAVAKVCGLVQVLFLGWFAVKSGTYIHVNPKDEL